MSDLIDRQALRAAHGLGYDCHDCKRDMKSCQYDRDYSLMDFCEWLDDAPTASTWHRVEEPPKPFEMVIAYVDPWHIFAAYHNGHGAWKENDGFKVIGVRYWMPIEPPKEDA